jgi:hypothetical protein
VESIFKTWIPLCKRRMDTSAIDARGIAPLQSDFEHVAAIRSIGGLVMVLARFQQMPEPRNNLNDGGAVVGALNLSAGPD